ncbi:MAG: hypothetical protein NXI32_07065 [bacterium]|nr:hypothetical protein [bacterium]
MAKMARREIFSPDEIACVHVMNRTVRRCFLMGDDPLTGKNFDHRKQWMEARLELHAANFGIDLLGEAILSNHFHLVLRSRPDVVATWKDREVARRWLMLCPLRKNRDGCPEKPTRREIRSITGNAERLRKIRSRLSDISWWMRLLCQHIAQRANQETGETGKFWESRFRSVRLLDESALLACVAYVDLNLIRAELAATIEESDFTSAKKRLEALLLQTGAGKQTNGENPDGISSSPDRSLAPLYIDERSDAPAPLPNEDRTRCSNKGFLNLTPVEYLQLLDWTARQVVAGKRGSTPSETPPLLQRVGLAGRGWLELVSDFGRLFYNVAGSPTQIAQARTRVTHRRFRVRSKVIEAYSSA